MRGISFDQFVRRRVSAIADHTCDLSPWDYNFGRPLMCEQHKGKSYANLMRMRVHKYKSWIREIQDLPHAILLRHEDLVSDAPMSLDKIARACAIKPPVSCKQVGDYKGLSNLGQYTRKHYCPISVVTANRIAAESDAELESALGYNLEQVLSDSSQNSTIIDDNSLRTKLGDYVPMDLLSEFDICVEDLRNKISHLEEVRKEQHNYMITLFRAFDKDRPKRNLRLQLPKAARDQIKQLRKDGLIP